MSRRPRRSCPSNWSAAPDDAHGSGNSTAVRIDEPGTIGKKPAFERYRPNQIRRLRHFHVIGVRRQIHRAHAQRNGVRIRIHIRIERHAFCHSVVHAALHECAMMRVPCRLFLRDAERSKSDCRRQKV